MICAGFLGFYRTYEGLKLKEQAEKTEEELGFYRTYEGLKRDRYG
ncbi:hypothetical protein GBL_3632 [Geobacillus kaustophilus GBlys]|uniref:Uncharacterized protein n=1 Tax=Geobacillus kaustophilus GBlys TaxID=1337888 RepID=U2X8X4_GEOKU|nr:hypothetical protein GBL_3632 [Geobacillus kaustophilus GBlys]